MCVKRKRGNDVLVRPAGVGPWPRLLCCFASTETTIPSPSPSQQGTDRQASRQASSCTHLISLSRRPLCRALVLGRSQANCRTCRDCIQQPTVSGSVWRHPPNATGRVVQNLHLRVSRLVFPRVFRVAREEGGARAASARTGPSTACLPPSRSSRVRSMKRLVFPVPVSPPSCTRLAVDVPAGPALISAL